MEAETILSLIAIRSIKENPKPLDKPSNYMQNNFSQEGDTSKMSSKAGEGCYGSQSKIYPVIFHLLLSDGASSGWEK